MSKYFDVPVIEEPEPLTPTPIPEEGPATPTPEEPNPNPKEPEPEPEDPKPKPEEPEDDIEAREEREYLDLLKVRNALSKKRKSRKDRQFFKDNPGLEAQVLALRQKKLKVTKGTHDKIKITEEPGIISEGLKELIQTPEKVNPEKIQKEKEFVMAPVPKKEDPPEPEPEPEPVTPALVILQNGRFF